MLLQGKNALIMGVANQRSIAYGVAQRFKEQGCNLAFTYPGEAIKKRVEPIAEELGGEFIAQCDVSSDDDIAACVETVKSHWDKVDILVHSIGFADRNDLSGRYVETSRKGFALAMDISAFSLVAVAGAFEPLMPPNSSIMTMTYYGSDKVIPNYNVMGVCKAALEASVRYLAYDMGEKGIRVNAVSAGPIKTLAASGISGFKSILNYIEEFAPMRTNVTPEDVGDTAVYLASDLSKRVTGEVIFVDSGYHVMGVGL